jgi:hypothetical protein
MPMTQYAMSVKIEATPYFPKPVMIPVIILERGSINM